MRYIKVIPHLSQEDLQSKLKSVKGFWRVQQLLVVINGMKPRQTANNISNFVDLSKHQVAKIIQQYNKEGASFFDRQGQGGRKYGLMTLDQEKDFLKECEQKGKEGDFTTTAGIQKLYEEKVGKQVAKSTLYRLLKRHNWRKLTARPSHPKKDVEKQEAFKKNSQNK